MADHRHREQLAAYDRLTGHPHYGYRACAPDPDNPAVTAADPDVRVDVWLTPDQERQTDRPLREQQALALCAGCPIQEACLSYALQHETGGKALDIWGGMTGEQRKDTLRREQAITAQPPAGPTELDLRVLYALAAHRTPAAVARAAGLTVTRANWHRSKLCTALGLDGDTTTRTQLLYAARRAGHLDPTTPIRPDRGITAAIPSRQADVERAHKPALPGLETVANVRRLTTAHTLTNPNPRPANASASQDSSDGSAATRGELAAAA